MILCVGTTPVMQRTMTFTRLQIDAVNRAADVRETASGKSINVARVAHTLGADVVATGFLGGSRGAFIRSDLDAAGIAHDFVSVQPNTRMCVTMIDHGGGTATELIEESQEVEPSAWDLLREKVGQLLPRARVTVLSGTLTPNAPQDFYAWCVGQASARGVKSIVDATGQPLREALKVKPFLVKPNRSELTATFGDNLSATLGADWVIVTSGKDGISLSDGKASWRMKAPPVKAISAIGSGDSLAAGVATGLLRGQSMLEACRLGVACGAANAMLPVAGYLRREDVDAIVPRVEVTEVR